MNSTDPEPLGEIASDELRRVLQPAFRTDHGTARRIVRLDKLASPYGSSFPLDDLTVYFDDGTHLDLIFKNTHPRALSPAARRAKPAFLDDPLREIELYRSVLDSSKLGTAACYCTVVDPPNERYWLFLEKVAGRELYQVGEFALWRRAAQWLAQLHSQTADSIPLAARARLIRYDADYYERWLERATSFFAERRDSNPQPELWQCLTRHYPEIVRDLVALPTSLIHGEFYASNVIVQALPEGVRVCPIDWERAAVGPGLVDLAALTAGNWSEQQRADLALEYFSSLRPRPPELLNFEAVWRGLQLCRLHLAVQWLGWSPDWSPPQEHRQDWLAEAANAAALLGYWRPS